jgi:hypothetical protein
MAKIPDIEPLDKCLDGGPDKAFEKKTIFKGPKLPRIK